MEQGSKVTFQSLAHCNPVSAYIISITDRSVTLAFHRTNIIHVFPQRQRDTLFWGTGGGDGGGRGGRGDTEERSTKLCHAVAMKREAGALAESACEPNSCFEPI